MRVLFFVMMSEKTVYRSNGIHNSSVFHFSDFVSGILFLKLIAASGTLLYRRIISLFAFFTELLHFLTSYNQDDVMQNV